MTLTNNIKSLYYNDFALLPVGSHTVVSLAGANQTISVTAPANGIIMQSTGTQNVRYRLDGTAADASTGFLMEPTDSEVRLDLSEGLILNIFGAAGAVVQYQLYRTL